MLENPTLKKVKEKLQKLFLQKLRKRKHNKRKEVKNKMIAKIYGPNVLVEPKNAEETTQSGIILTGAKGKKQQISKVVMVGEGHILNDGTRVELPFEIGDNVIIQQYAGTQIVDGEHEYLLVNERDVIAKVSG